MYQVVHYTFVSGIECSSTKPTTKVTIPSPISPVFHPPPQPTPLGGIKIASYIVTTQRCIESFKFRSININL